MRSNIGRTNSYIRTIAGFTILSIATARMAKKPWKKSFFLLAVLGAMKVAEGLMQFCPLVALWDKRNNWMDDALNWESETSNYLHHSEVGSGE
ncbi:YgaP family membrane protein [Jeotgalibacillus campisalis]|uniref:Inner membrane protein YgaP-like transmembrane domain-containing protein n=1 Tax=Jeotgalibacillus campisalis TaxID=220754 RepID=A0A0C2VDM4_9BACL|nr:DUF2892 domain-containing protein [Jeotgalibacillus campisalis]KIL47007.1 hypothetical protein KR50_23290 [Jeotgalibacillus campisalis]